MGICAYCGTSTGLFSSTHRECQLELPEKLRWHYSLPPAFIASLGIGIAASWAHILTRSGFAGFAVFAIVIAGAVFGAYVLFVTTIWILSIGYRKELASQESQINVMEHVRSLTNSPDFEPEAENERWLQVWDLLDEARSLNPYNYWVVRAMWELRERAADRLRKKLQHLPMDEFTVAREKFYRTFEIPGVRVLRWERNVMTWARPSGGSGGWLERRSILSIPGIADRLFTSSLWGDTFLDLPWTPWSWTSAPLLISASCIALVALPLGRDRYGETYLGRLASEGCARYLPICSSDVRGYTAKQSAIRLEQALAHTHPSRVGRAQDLDRVMPSDLPSCFTVHVENSDRVEITRKQMFSERIRSTLLGFEVVYQSDMWFDQDSWPETLARHVWRVFPPSVGSGWVFEDGGGYSSELHLEITGLPDLEGFTCTPTN